MKKSLRNIVAESLKDEVHVDVEWNRLVAAIVKLPGNIPVREAGLRVKHGLILFHRRR